MSRSAITLPVWQPHPLMLATVNGHVDVVGYLLAKGAKADTRGRGGVTARSLALERSNTAIVQLLDAHVAKASGEAKPPADAARP